MVNGLSLETVKYSNVTLYPDLCTLNILYNHVSIRDYIDYNNNSYEKIFDKFV